MTGRQKRKLRTRLSGEQNHRCCHCGGAMFLPETHEETKHPLAVTVEHIVPRARGGSNAWENLAAAHRKCNMDRGAPPLSVDMESAIQAAFRRAGLAPSEVTLELALCRANLPEDWPQELAAITSSQT